MLSNSFGNHVPCFVFRSSILSQTFLIFVKFVYPAILNSIEGEEISHIFQNHDDVPKAKSFSIFFGNASCSLGVFYELFPTIFYPREFIACNIRSV